MAAFARKTNRFFPVRGRARARERLRPPPSAALIDAVLEHADLRDELGGGRVLLRIGPARLADPKVRKALGSDAGRAGDVAIIWDEREDVLFRVLDGAPPPLAAVRAARPAEDRFALTPAALAYIAASQSRGHG
ncbi:MAG: hypothetical protein ABI376_00290 [Caulobacteraceae bacterium]